MIQRRHIENDSNETINRVIKGTEEALAILNLIFKCLSAVLKITVKPLVAWKKLGFAWKNDRESRGKTTVLMVLWSRSLLPCNSTGWQVTSYS